MPISTLILSAWGSLKRYRLIGSIEVQGSISVLMEPQPRGGITLIVHFLGAKKTDNSKGGKKSLDMDWG